MSCILDEYEPYWCEADWNCKDCPNWVEDREIENGNNITIEKHIDQLKKLKSFHNGSYGASINFAIDTMRKYQKIEQIVNDELEDFHPLDRNPYKIALIKKVVEYESNYD